MTMGAILLRIEDSFEKAWVDKQLKSMQCELITNTIYPGLQSWRT